MDEDDNPFAFSPPDYDNHQQGASFMPPNAEAAWMLQLIKIRVKIDKSSLPVDIKQSLADDISMYLENASMTNISMGQILEFIHGFDELWMRYKIFRVKKKYVPELNYLMTFFKEMLVMNLNKSKEGWQGNHVFERHVRYDVKQTHKDISERLKKFFFGKKKEEENSGGG